MNMLIKLMPPPKDPVESGKDQDWMDIEKKIGVTLPTDYKEYISNYGSGRIGDFLWIFNPFSKDPYLNLVTQSEEVLDTFRIIKAKHGEKVCPYPIFPETGGLLPFGYTDNGDDLLWLTKGKAEEWVTVVHRSRSFEYEEYKDGIMDFLTKLVSGKLRSDIIHSDFIDQRRLFAPASKS